MAKRFLGHCHRLPLLLDTWHLLLQVVHRTLVKLRGCSLGGGQVCMCVKLGGGMT